MKSAPRGVKGAAPYLVPAVHKAVQIVRHLNVRAPEGATLAELTEAAAITRSHCHSILRTLADESWVDYDARERRYRLKSGLVADASSALRAMEFLTTMRPFVAALVRRASLPCIVTQQLADGSFVVVDRMEHPTDLGVTVHIGHRFPSDAPAQMRAALAWADPDQIERVVATWTPKAYTRNTIVTRAALLRELEDTRRRGYAHSVNEYLEGVSSIAAPVFDTVGGLLCILQCPGFFHGVMLREHETGRALFETVREIHAQLGGTPPCGFGDAFTGRSPGVARTRRSRPR